MSVLDRIAVALDTSDREQFRSLSRLFGPRAGVLKVGLEAYTRWGPELVREVRDTARGIFLDLKLHDIPNTVAGAVRAAADLGVDYLTVHAGGGARMLEAASEAAEGRLRLLAVTVLTHLDPMELERLGLPGPAPERALSWATMAHQAGCHGAVSSPHEVAALREQLPEPFVLVTPGIRFGSVDGDDQRRVATPESALADGASLLVIGRPLTAASDPSAAMDALERRLEGGSVRVDAPPPGESVP